MSVIHNVHENYVWLVQTNTHKEIYTYRDTDTIFGGQEHTQSSL